MSCDDDQACEAVAAYEVMPDTCLPSISCDVAVADAVELDPIRDELRELDEEYRQQCGLCPVANCVPEERVYSQCEAGRCDLEALPRSEGEIRVTTTMN